MAENIRYVQSPLVKMFVKWTASFRYVLVAEQRVSSKLFLVIFLVIECFTEPYKEQILLTVSVYMARR